MKFFLSVIYLIKVLQDENVPENGLNWQQYSKVRKIEHFSMSIAAMLIQFVRNLKKNKQLMLIKSLKTIMSVV